MCSLCQSLFFKRVSELVSQLFIAKVYQQRKWILDISTNRSLLLRHINSLQLSIKPNPYFLIRFQTRVIFWPLSGNSLNLSQLTSGPLTSRPTDDGGKTIRIGNNRTIVSAFFYWMHVRYSLRGLELYFVLCACVTAYIYVPIYVRTKSLHIYFSQFYLLSTAELLKIYVGVF